jgi:hypothetical protein
MRLLNMTIERDNWLSNSIAYTITIERDYKNQVAL